MCAITHVKQREQSHSLFEGVASGTIAKVFTSLAKFGSQIVFARLLGPNIYGAYKILISLTQVIDWPISGWSDATKKRLSEKREQESEIIGALLIIGILFFISISVLAYMLEIHLVDYTTVENSYLLLVALVLHVIIFYPLLGIILSKERLSRAMWMETGQATLALLIQISLLQIGFGLEGLVAGLLCSTLIITLLSTSFIPNPSIPTLQTIRSLWKYAKFSSISKILGKGYDRFDVLLIGALIGPSSVGYYEAAAVLAAPALFMSNVISSGIMPKISRLNSMDQEIKSSSEEALQLSPYLAIPVFFGAIVLSDRLVPTVFGGSYLAGATLLPALSLYYVLRSISSPLSEIINGIDAPQYNAAISAGTLVLNIILGIILGIYYSTIGIVVATVISETIRFIIYYWLVSKRGIVVISKIQFIMIVCAGTMATMIYIYRYYFPGISSIELIAIVSLGAIFYFATTISLSSTLQMKIRGLVQ